MNRRLEYPKCGERNKADGTTITISNPDYVTGEKSDWQLIIDEGDGALTVDEWFPTKLECYEFCVDWMMNTTEG